MKEILNRKIETQPNLSKRILAGVIDYTIIFGYCFYSTRYSQYANQIRSK